MKDLLVSVVIPVGPGAEYLGECMDRVTRQDHPKLEIIVVCEPAAANLASLPSGSDELRVIRERDECSLAHLVNTGMRAARGHVKILLMPHCVPSADDWVTTMAEPFSDDAVGAVVSQCEVEANGRPPLMFRLLESVDPQASRNRSGGLEKRLTVSYVCDAYRASLLADIGYFGAEAMGSPGEAIDASVKIADAGYSVVLSDRARAAYRIPRRRCETGLALRGALDFGRADAVLDRMYELRWLNSGVCAAALLSLFLLPVAALSLPIALILSFAVFVWGWFLAVRIPILGWECPTAVLNFAASATVVLLIRDDWWPELFGRELHPAIVRQWCWLAAVTASYLLVLLLKGLWSAIRSCRRLRDLPGAPAVLVLSLAWWLLAGVGYVRARLGDGSSRT
jgi:hypothetical protein